MRTELAALLVAVLLFLLHLFVERFLLDRRLESIPLRVAVTGTRGKSSVVRLLASILRADGRQVVAKTTGSEPRYLLPDGKEVEVPRRGVPSIIEQKKLVKRAAAMGADCVVAEIMSIHPENHRIESHRLLRPQIVVLTNVRLDHTDAMGETEDEIAEVLALGFAPGATVFVPESENRRAFASAVAEMGGALVEVSGRVEAESARERPGQPAEEPTDPADLQTEAGPAEFSENIDLARAVGRHLGIAEEVIAAGIRDAAADAGAVRVWEYRSEQAAKSCYLVNGFAANDPRSTLQVVAQVREALPSCPDRLTGLLALRPDRGDRTVQWIEAIRSGDLDCFDCLYIVGGHARAVKRKLPEVRVLSEDRPEQLMATIMADIGDGGVLFGCGNYVGTGQLLVDHWERTGTRHGL